ncbi:hypothetical protein DICVIV_09712 [Dictyocaulus viviparus]|uniref:Saposin B-type domain-containing protein n=1 Tax=Dictyocaulus viviparus TaxID=29172 RepID=A0A0D8XKK3_DICVI|nr:hypothetical protein DICVIV_09712 [Dictyocaulus viviparus]
MNGLYLTLFVVVLFINEGSSKPGVLDKPCEVCQVVLNGVKTALSNAPKISEDVIDLCIESACMTHGPLALKICQLMDRKYLHQLFISVMKEEKELNTKEACVELKLCFDVPQIPNLNNLPQIPKLSKITNIFPF